MVRLKDDARFKLQVTEENLRKELASIMGDREQEWRRVSALAGLDENGCIIPLPVIKKNTPA